MNKRTANLLRRLDLVELGRDDALAMLTNIADELKACSDSQAAIEPVLRFIEEHPNDDLGAPGPLVRFVERFYRHGYEEKLLESIARRATELNVWMLNRIINGAKGSKKREYAQVMAGLAKDSTQPGEIRALAAEFLED